jgi:hypothetical protein
MEQKIYTSIANIINEIGAIGKDKKNVQQGFMYRGVDDVMNALQPLLAKHKVFIVPEILEHIREERQTKTGSNLIYSICKIRYTFYSDDGSHFDSVVIGEGMDSGDKATNKAMAIAFKYACFQVFCIPTEEMKDPDAEAHEVQGKQKPIPAKAPTKPVEPPEAKEEAFISSEQRKRLFAIAGGNELIVKEAIESIGIESTKKIPVSMYDNICKIVEKAVKS